MLLLSPFGIQLHQADVNARLADTIDAYVKITANLVAGFDVAFDVDLSYRQFLPA